MSKEVLALDKDEVIFPFVREFSAWHNDVFGSSLKEEDFYTYEFEHILGVSISETVARVHRFLEQGRGHKEVSPIEQSVEAVTRLTSRFDVHIVTARHPSFERVTKTYLEEHFGGLITNLTMVGHVATMEVLRLKAEVCEEIGAVALIDDSPWHLNQCVDRGIKGVLFGDYGWNRQVEVNPGIIRCSDWQAVVEYFNV